MTGGHNNMDHILIHSLQFSLTFAAILTLSSRHKPYGCGDDDETYSKAECRASLLFVCIENKFFGQWEGKDIIDANC
jgi:hypothetical protein